jgi:23S rRNA (adenine2030-N6)-methyltransferase
LWYAIKQRRALRPVYGGAAQLPAKSALLAELLVRPDEFPLRMNGSGLLLLNAPWQFDRELSVSLDTLAAVLAPGAPPPRVESLRDA